MKKLRHKTRPSRPKPQPAALTGIFQPLRSGGGLVQCANGPSLFIPPQSTGGAWPRDKVRVELLPAHGRSQRHKGGGNGGTGRRPEGRVVGIVERTLTEVPAHVAHRAGNTLLCHAADSRLDADFSVRLGPGDQCPPIGSLILLKPLQCLASRLWSAEILGAYGREDDIAVQEALVRLNHQTPDEFSPSALEEIANLPAEPEEGDMRGREDMRHLPFVTIDGDDARDFDDAVHVQPQGQGWLLRVAIADVSHYVRPNRGKGLDGDALERGNSWYFPTSVAPMLPFALSNGLCSLNPGKDRLAMLVELPFNAQGQPGKARFAAIVMRSSARLTYGQVHACCCQNDAQALARLRALPQGQAILDMLGHAFGLYALLRDVRKARGSLDFDLPEAQASFDAQGRMTDFAFRERNDAHRLIEEFMIAANEAVARHLGQSGLPFPYRVHPAPDMERMEQLRGTLATLALDEALARLLAKERPGHVRPELVRTILAAAQGSGQEYLLGRLCLRAMTQARYQPLNEGHFGLASTDYCHFTSPIRRYADLLTHRALKTSLGLDAGPIPAGQKLLRVCDHINRQERAALECEREMDRRLACLALQGHEGESFAALVSGVNAYGVFAELRDLPAEGMIRVEDLGNDWFALDATAQCLVGQRTGASWRMGQPVEVRLVEVSLGRLEIRLVPASLPPRADRSGRPDRHGKAAKCGKTRRESARCGNANAGNEAKRGAKSGGGRENQPRRTGGGKGGKGGRPNRAGRKR